MKEICESERPREKLLGKGPQALGNGELLAILIRTGTKDESALELGARLLGAGGGTLCGLFGMDKRTLTGIPGIKADKAATILAAFELGKRFVEEKATEDRKSVVSARQVYDMMIPQMKGLSHEECYLLLLGAGNVFLGKAMLSCGGSESTTMDAGKAVRLAIQGRASKIILVHNHPSGRPEPSDADIARTSALRSAARCCDIALLDHIIISDNCFFSFEAGCVSTV